MGQWGAVEPGPDGDALPGQILGALLAVHRRQEGQGARLVGTEEGMHPQLFQSRGAALHLAVLPAGDGIPPAQHIPHSRLQPRRPGDVHGAGLQPLRQQLRHIPAKRLAARAAEEQRGGLPGAQQQPGALGAQQPLVPRHGDKRRPQPVQFHRQGSGGLGRIQDKGDSPLPAHGRHLLHRQHIAEHVGHMGKHRRLRPGPKGPGEFLQGILPAEQPPSGDLQLGPQGIQGPHHCIVLEAGHRHPGPGPHQGADGDIQAMGAVGGQHHLLRAAAEKPGRRLPAAEHRPGPQLRRRVAAPARTGTAGHGPGHRPVYLRRLMEGGCAVVQINHSSISSKPPSPCRRYTLPMGSC